MLKTGAIFLYCSCLLAASQPMSEGTHAYEGKQAFANVTLGPYRRKTEQAPVWLRSGPHSGLSKPIIVIHSCDQYLTASWQGVLVQHTPLSYSLNQKKPKERKRKQRAKICVFSDNVHISIISLFLTWLQQNMGYQTECFIMVPFLVWWNSSTNSHLLNSKMPFSRDTT